jgi:hypothetical protein
VPTHGKSAQITINTKDISPYVTSVTFQRGNDTHDVTTFGSLAHSYIAGLIDGQVTINGLWDKTALVGSEVVFNSMVGTAAGYAFVYGPEGSTVGNVKYTGTVVLDNYSESTPVADLVTFTAQLKISGSVTLGTY